MSNLKELVEIVRASRERTAEYFPLPDIKACIDYAITEAAEHLDAVLREKRNGDKRNNAKEHDARKEWGQCGYMVASAIIQDTDNRFVDEDWFWDFTAWPGCENVYTLLVYMAGIQAGLSKHDFRYINTLDKWDAASRDLGYDSAELLRETCAAFEAKHIPAA
jgi:hypothetical protein